MGNAVILSRAWATTATAVLLGAWVAASSTFFVGAQWVEYGGYLVASTALAIGLNVARRAMVTRLEATKHAAELGREALRRVEADLREISEKVPEGVLIHRDGNVCYANPAIAAYLRAPSPEALVGREVASLIHPDNQAGAEAFLSSSSSNHAQRTHGFVRGDGERVMLEIDSSREIHFQGAPAVLITAKLSSSQPSASRAASSGSAPKWRRITKQCPRFAATALGWVKCFSTWWSMRLTPSMRDMSRTTSSACRPRPMGTATSSSPFGIRAVASRRIIRIVSELEGRISVESRKGKGTTFRVVLPAAERDDRAPRVEADRPVARSSIPWLRPGQVWSDGSPS